MQREVWLPLRSQTSRRRAARRRSQAGHVAGGPVTESDSESGALARCGWLSAGVGVLRISAGPGPGNTARVAAAHGHAAARVTF